MFNVRVSIIASVLVIGCTGSQPDVLTYDEFKAHAYLEPDTGMYIINGDELVENEAGMLAMYDAFLQSVADAADRADGLATIEQGLIVNRVSGRDDKWSTSAAQNITYCVSQSSFGSRYSTVVSAMTSAAGAWEGTGARVNFVHSSGQDGSCSRTNTSVVFNVRQVSGTGFLARAFFPSSSRSAREVLIDSSAFSPSRYTLAGILRHELGHALGFRHEHTRPEAGTCFENNSWRALTTYDSASVMHYPQCRGTNTGDLVLTARDRSGADILYP